MTDRVRNEVEIHSRLKHPGILELYQYFENDTYVFLVLELAEQVCSCVPNYGVPWKGERHGVTSEKAFLLDRFEGDKSYTRQTNRVMQTHYTRRTILHSLLVIATAG